MDIVVVDDEVINLAVLSQIAQTSLDCSVRSFSDPHVALDSCRADVTDLIFVDFQMPGMNGVEFIRAIRGDERYRHVPIVMITADSERRLRIDAIAAGATDFLNKPIFPDELRLRARNLLNLRRAQLELSDRAVHLAAEVERSMERLLAGEDEMIWRMARAIEHRDGGTGDHISRVATASKLLAETMGLPPHLCLSIYRAAPLHDVGKIGIPDSILNKPGALDPEERSMMQRHVDFGADILANGTTDLVRIAQSIAATHHEKWDGTGYPKGLRGDAIPIEGRIVGLADFFDAVMTVRPYKRAWTIEETMDEIRAQTGRHFDPACVVAFEKIWPKLLPMYQGADSANEAA